MPGLTTGAGQQFCACERQQAQSASKATIPKKNFFMVSITYLRPYSGSTLRRARMVTATVAMQQTITIQKKLT